jgi:hypothetical protein
MSLRHEADCSPLHELCELITGALSAHRVDPRSIQVVAVDHDSSGNHSPLAGLVSLLDAESIADGLAAMPPTLLLGLAAENKLRETITLHPDADALFALMDWPGLVYLRYGFNVHQLVHAARRAQAGAGAPLRLDRRASAAARMRLCRGVKHWIKGRIAATQGAAMVFDEAASTGMTPHRTVLEPVAALTAEHRDMMSRLIRMEPSSTGPPSSEAVTDVSIGASLARFEAVWLALEACRSDVRRWSLQDPADSSPGSTEAYRSAAQLHFDACEALQRLQAAVEALEARIWRQSSRSPLPI